MARIKGKVKPPYLIAVGGLLFQLMMLSDLPQLSLAVMSTILCAVLIFLTWRVKKDFPVPAKVITTGSLLFFSYFPILLSHKMWILFSVFWFVVLVLIERVFRHAVYKKMNADIILAQLLYLLCWLGAAANNYGYGKNSSVPFWKVSLAVAIVFGVFQAVVTEQTEKDIKKNIIQRLLVFLVYGLVSFFIVSVGVQNLNYALDVREPTRYSTVIEAKRSHRSRKRSYRYFRFTVNGETIELDVSASTYRAYNEGDTYNITRYEGAFGVPFYMVGEN